MAMRHANSQRQATTTSTTITCRIRSVVCEVEKAENASGSLRHMMRSVGRSVGRGASESAPDLRKKPLRFASPMRTVVESGFRASFEVETEGVDADGVKYEW